jgi:hypothetical protein
LGLPVVSVKRKVTLAGAIPACCHLLLEVTKMVCMSEKLSKCCGKDVKVEGGDEGTYYYVCKECDKACDLKEWYRDDGH